MKQINIESMLNIAIKKTSSTTSATIKKKNSEKFTRGNESHGTIDESSSKKHAKPKSTSDGASRSSNSWRKSDSMRNYWFSPTVKSYLKYYLLIERNADELACTLKNERFVSDLVAVDERIADEGIRLDDHSHFIALMCKACHLSRSVVSTKTLQRSIDLYEKNNKRWIATFSNNLNLCSFEDAPPILVQVSFGKDDTNTGHSPSTSTLSSTTKFRNSGSTPFDKVGFESFVQKNCIKPIKLDLYSLLFDKTKITRSNDTNDVYSLEIRKLKKIGRNSVYYRRIYASHVIIFLLCREITASKKTVKIRLLINRHFSFLFRIKTTPLIKMLLDKRILFEFL